MAEKTLYDAALWRKIEARVIPEPNAGCMLWLGCCFPEGYGEAMLGGYRERRTHRLAWIAIHGPIPDGLHVLHKCDVRSCCNPHHLFLGTNADNVADRQSKGRTRTASGPAHYLYGKRGRNAGENNNTTKLTRAQVLEIESAAGTNRELAAQHNISRQLVSRIKRREVWKFLW